MSELIEIEGCLRAIKLRLAEGQTSMAIENVREAQGWVRVLCKQHCINLIKQVGPDPEVDDQVGPDPEEVDD